MKRFISLVLTLGLLSIYGQYALAEDYSLWKFSLIQGSAQIHDPNDREGFLDPGASGYSLGYEYVSELDDHFEMGLGSEMNLVALSKNNVHLAYIPVLGSVDYFPYTIDKPLYLKARIGYNLFFFGDLYDYYKNDPNAYYTTDRATGGLNCGFGMGLKITNYPNLRLEALYTISNGSSQVRKTPSTYDGNYSETEYLANVSCSMLDLSLRVSF